MKYIEFEIKNYKGVGSTVKLDLKIKPETNIFTLVGLNESGKTSILEAINLLQNDKSNEDAHKMIHKSLKGNFNDSISIAATFELDDDDKALISKVIEKNKNINLSEILRQSLD